MLDECVCERDKHFSCQFCEHFTEIVLQTLTKTKRFLSNRTLFILRHELWKNMPILIHELFRLAVCIEKFESLREPIRILLFDCRPVQPSTCKKFMYHSVLTRIKRHDQNVRILRSRVENCGRAEVNFTSMPLKILACWLASSDKKSYESYHKMSNINQLQYFIRWHW